MKENSCPVCSQPISGSRAPRLKQDGLASVLASVLVDIDTWAEGDVIANDGEILHVADLARYLANELAIPLMRRYASELRRHRVNHKELLRRVSEEQQIVDAVVAGKRPASVARGRHRKAECKRGHARTPDNVASNGECVPCRSVRKARVGKC